MTQKKEFKKNKDFKSVLKRTWHFIWHDDSLLSWVVNVVLAFVLIKFIIYPAVGFILVTTHPVVAVVSGSMEHKAVEPCIESVGGICIKTDSSKYWLCDEYFDDKKRVDYDFFWKTCGDFYEDKGITKDEFSDFRFSNGFNTGDIIIIKGSEPEDIEVGDVIVFHASKNYPIIHRVVEKKLVGDEIFFTTKGDHNPASGTDDMDINENNVIGKAVFRVPYLGWLKLGLFKLMNSVSSIF